MMEIGLKIARRDMVLLRVHRGSMWGNGGMIRRTVRVY